jgi:predicted dehydrogenase/nucleoside-diphosphate-sugar epimerase
MAQSKPRLAIIGCGAVVEHHIIPSLRRQAWLPNVLVDTSPKRLAILKRQMGARGKSVITAADWTAVGDKFDAAIVASPHTLHGPMGTALAAAGKHVFMEKPLATNVADCRTMIAASEESGTTLSVGLLRRYLSLTEWIKALLDSRILGEVKEFHVREGFVFNWATSSLALLRRDLAGGGVLMDTGAHVIDLLFWWFGNLYPIEYLDDAEAGVESDCVVHVQIASGAPGRIELSRSRNLPNTIRIIGENGFVEAHLYKNEVIAGSDNVLAFAHKGLSPSGLKSQLFADLFDAEMRDFLASASGVERVGVSGREAVDAINFIESCYRIRKPLVLPWTQLPQPIREEHHLIPSGSTVAITGATGFIGGRLVEQLAEAGVNVRCLVRDMRHAARIARLPVSIIPVNLANASEVSSAIEGADYVFHCAYDVRSREQNIRGALNLIDACAMGAVKRLVHVSTFSVYEPFPDGEINEETRDGDRSWIYVRNKLDIEKEILEASRSGRIDATVIQPSIVYGPFGKSWTNDIAEMLAFNQIVLPKEEGLCNAVYIDDLTYGLVLAAVHPAAKGERFIMSGPEPVHWAHFFQEFARALSVPGPLFWPKSKIAQSTNGLANDIRHVMSNPKHLIQIIVRWPPARHMLQAGLDSMPISVRSLVNKYYFARENKRIGQIVLPDKQKCALYTAMACVDSRKARRMLGYAPCYDFRAGMANTASYLTWAYGDAVRHMRTEASSVRAPTLDLANAR